MSQQLGIIVAIDVAAAVKEKTLDGNVYMFDNMKLQGSEGLGTGSLVSALNGTHWLDGSQANELVLNWAVGGLGSIPPTVPKTFLADKSRNSDLQALEELENLTKRIETSQASVQTISDELKKISRKKGVKAKVQSRRRNLKRELGVAGQKVMDITGEIITDPSDKTSQVNQVSPIITNITGEAVDKKVMYVAEYGSPELVTDGWYWCGSVDSSKPGTYAYTMHIELHEQKYVDGEWTLVPIDLTCEAYIKVSDNPKVNGFTGAGIGMLPIM